ncbi:MAG TPA: DUF5668 domain-containing protein [Sphingobacteriaceae bacterium]|nr:DUF5668 domain-containing protein [Sphingobacteriaceae bacterium]
MMGGVGRITLAVAMIALGLGLLAHNLNLVNGLALIRWWPLLLILLGAEMVIRSRKNGQGQRLDGFSLVVVLLLTGVLAVTSWLASWFPVGSELADLVREPWHRGFRGPWSFNARFTHRETVTVAEPVTAATSLRVETTVSSVRIVAAQEDEDPKVTAQATVVAWGVNEAEAIRVAQEVQLELQEQGDEMVLTMREGERGMGPDPSFALDLEVTVPRQMGATVAANLGEVMVEGLAGPVMVTADVGDVQLKNVSGPVDVTAKVGDIQIQVPADVPANVDLSTTMGDLQVDGIDAAVERRGPSVFAGFQLGDGSVPVKARAEVGSIRLTLVRGL